MWRFVAPAYSELTKAQKTQRPFWSVPSLRDVILACLENTERHVNLVLFLDALDESSSDNEELISFIKKLECIPSPCLHLKICVASREWTIFSNAFAQNPSFEIHEHTSGDIVLYVQRNLIAAVKIDQDFADNDNLMQLIKQVEVRATGVFIWVRIVVDEFSRDLRDGTPVATLQQIVRSLPEPGELDELYVRTFTRIDRRYQNEGFVMMMIVLSSPQHFTVVDFIDCLSAPEYDNLQSPAAPPLATTSELRRRLQSRSGGLLGVGGQANEALPRTLNETNNIYIVQFIHQMAREFALRFFEYDIEGASQELQGGTVGYAFFIHWVCAFPRLEGARGESQAKAFLESFLNVFQYAKAYDDAITAPVDHRPGSVNSIPTARDGPERWLQDQLQPLRDDVWDWKRVLAAHRLNGHHFLIHFLRRLTLHEIKEQPRLDHWLKLAIDSSPYETVPFQTSILCQWIVKITCISWRPLLI